MNKKTRVTDLTGLNKTLLPKLRFPDFQEEWGSEKLGNISFFVNERVSLEKLSLDTYISTENILPDYEGVTKASKLPPSGSAIQYKKDDILISNIRPYLKKVWFSNKDGGASNDVIIVRAKEKIAPKYLSFMLINDVFIEYVMNGAKGVKMPRGDIFLMKEFPLAYPSIPEQQKIADCLTSLDDLIATQSQKVAALQAYKKGLMQNLFPAEGESVPRLRFPEFESAGEWEEKTLGEVATFSKGKGISKADTSPNGLHQCIRYGELYTLYKETITTVASYTNLPLEDLVLSEANDVIIPTSGETEIDIATASCVLRSGIALGGDLSIIRSEINGVFLSYYLNNAKKKDIAKLAQGIAVVHLYSNQLKTLKINVPQKHEQAKIAELLTALDEQISAQGEAVAALKVHKRGLLQGLFPNQTSEVFKTSEV